MTLKPAVHAFYSDNTASVAPELLAAIAAANDGPQKAYGDDPWTGALDATFSEFFGTPVRAFVVTSGTAANALSLATLSPPYGNVYCHAGAHVVEDECGAVEFFSAGARLRPDCGRSRPHRSRSARAGHRGSSGQRSHRAAVRAHADSGDGIGHDLYARAGRRTLRHRAWSRSARPHGRGTTGECDRLS